MSIYIYSHDCTDFASFGLVGALTPISCFFTEEINGKSMITMVHPLDALGRHTNLKKGNILKIDVPVRAVPEIRDGQIVTSAEKWTVRPENEITIHRRVLYRLPTGSARLAILPGGTQVAVVEKPEEGRYKVQTKYGNGYMEPLGLNYEESVILPDNANNMESVLPSWEVRPQLFRIYAIKPNMHTITVQARHISYDLLGNITNYSSNAEVSAIAAAEGILSGCIYTHDFKVHSNLADTRTGVHYKRINPISALLDPEEGLTTKWSCGLIRDNFDLYLLRDPGKNRGVTIEYAKNMTGISGEDSDENVVTAIIPLGETADGKELLLTDSGQYWVESPLINNYPVPHVQELQCEDCTVGTDGVTVDRARARMRAQAEKVFEDGGDKPEISLKVNFVLLGDTAQYAQYKSLDRLFLWDYAIVKHKYLDIDVTARVASIKWNCLANGGKGRMESMEIGTPGKTLSNTGINNWQIPQGFSGSKIASGSLGSVAMRDAIIAARHMQAGSVNADAIQAGSVTAEKIAAGAVDTVALDALTARIESLTAADIETDSLAAALAEFVTIAAKVAEFDFAAVENILANALILQTGQADKMMITNLAVTSANLLNAVIGKLVLMGDDGKYYEIGIGTDGGITTREITPEQGEIEAGEMGDGRQIVASSVNAETLNGQNVVAESAIIGQILTEALDAKKITAAEALLSSATIPTLYTTSVQAIGNSMTFSANETIQAIVGDQDEVKKWMIFDNEKGLIIRKPAWTDEDGEEHPASIWSTRTDEKGYHVMSDKLTEPAGSFEGGGLKTPSVQIGGIVCRKTGTNGLAWGEAD